MGCYPRRVNPEFEETAVCGCLRCGNLSAADKNRRKFLLYLLLQEFVNHTSDPPEAIKREEVGEDRLHCSFPTQPKEGHIRHDTKHGTNTIVSVHASQLISAEIYQPLPLSKTIPNTPMEVLLDLGRDHVGFPTYSRDRGYVFSIPLYPVSTRTPQHFTGKVFISTPRTPDRRRCKFTPERIHSWG